MPSAGTLSLRWSQWEGEEQPEERSLASRVQTQTNLEGRPTKPSFASTKFTCLVLECFYIDIRHHYFCFLLVCFLFLESHIPSPRKGEWEFATILWADYADDSMSKWGEPGRTWKTSVRFPAPPSLSTDVLLFKLEIKQISGTCSCWVVVIEVMCVKHLEWLLIHCGHYSCLLASSGHSRALVSHTAAYSR